jgi:hypothetical protein
MNTLCFVKYWNEAEVLYQKTQQAPRTETSDRQCTYNVKYRRLPVTIFALEKQ